MFFWMRGKGIFYVYCYIVLFLLNKVLGFNLGLMVFLSYSPISPVLPTNLSTAFWDN